MNQQTYLSPSEEFLRAIDRHRFHNPLEPKTCYICKVETFRQDNTPTVRWSKAVKTVVQPPMPVAIMILVILIQLIALALTINT
jgi:hypothetical protein